MNVAFSGKVGEVQVGQVNGERSIKLIRNVPEPYHSRILTKVWDTLW